MSLTTESLALEAFRRAAQRVPAYRNLLKESGVLPESVRGPEDWGRVPVSDKRGTFGRFSIDQLCLDGQLGRLGMVLTSSGHSGRFAYGLTPAEGLADAVRWIDDLLDFVFEVRARPTLLINCLPMGVKVSTQACTLAETSVRPDMVVGLVRTFAAHFSQIILVGEAAFVKHTLEQGRRDGVAWRDHCVHLILGEEPLAENARKYLEGILGIEVGGPRRGMVVSSMGVAELGLNLFSEVPPMAALVPLRRALHENAGLRRAVLGAADWVPALFTYDPRRIFVEFDDARRLIVTTLDPRLPLPLIRYATGDRGRVLRIDPQLRPAAEAAGVPWGILEAVPVVAVEGRGEHALAGVEAVYPEAVKEGLYHEAALAELTTANFRLSSGAVRARVRIQLSPGVRPEPQMAERFREAIARYARQPLEVVCEAYADFGDGMALDYERKFQYLER
jgi:phenylacetate-CoA ligase